jgi:hypothetical protein
VRECENIEAVTKNKRPAMRAFFIVSYSLMVSVSPATPDAAIGHVAVTPDADGPPAASSTAVIACIVRTAAVIVRIAIIAAVVWIRAVRGGCAQA